MPSKRTRIVPVRVEHELVARLEALASRVPDSNRTALARDALRRGVELLEAELERPKAPKKSAAPELQAQEPRRVGRALELFEPERPAEPAAQKSAAPAREAKEPRPASGGLEKFARDVLEAARHSRSGWVSAERLFIVHAWRAYRQAQPSRPPSLNVFKVLLVQARRKGLVELTADELAQFHRRSDVERSASHCLGETFHLLGVKRSAESWRKRA
jgi:hypothetical protein